MNAHTMQDLRQMQAMPLSIKIRMTEQRIRDWVNEYGEEGVYVSFSGGKDSTVLLDIVRNRLGLSRIPACFCDTGLEYPEIRDFVRTFDNVVWLKPKMTFKQVIEKYGYPFFSKETSNTVDGARKYLRQLAGRDIILTDRQTDGIIGACQMADLIGIERRKDRTEYQELKMGNIPNLPYRFLFEKMVGAGKYGNARIQILNEPFEHKEKGTPTGEISNRYNKSRYLFMLDSPYEISDRCCSVMKKAPMKKYHKETGRNAITAQMAEESFLRATNWMKYGCNGFEMKYPISNPMSFWTEQDVLHYIREYNIKICSVYGEIVPDQPEECDGQISIEDLGLMPDNRKLKTTGCNRTGCMFCGFGAHLEKSPNRFERMKITHPKQYEYIMKPKSEGGLGYKEVIDWINENGGMNIKY